MLMATKLGSEWLLPIKSHERLIKYCNLVASRDKLRFCISSIIMSMTSNLGRVVTYLERLLPLKLNELVILWSCEIPWQTGGILFLLPQCQWIPNPGVWWLNFRGSYPQSQRTFYSRGFTRSRDKLKALHLHYHKAYGRQTWQGDGLQCDS